MTGHYEIGWHSSDVNHCHVAFVLDGQREDLFDVALFHIEDEETDGAREESLGALELLVARANAALKEEATA